MERLSITLRGEYRKVIDKIQEKRPHLNNNANVVERALDFYLDDVVKMDKLGLGGTPIGFKIKKGDGNE